MATKMTRELNGNKNEYKRSRNVAKILAFHVKQKSLINKRNKECLLKTPSSLASS
jgi:hypothetical protein